MKSAQEINEEIKESLKHWKEIVQKYQQPHNGKAILQMITTFLPYIGLWVLMYFVWNYSILLALLIGVVNAFFLVRIFIIQHDCGHQSFLGNSKVNDVIGYVCSVFSTIPYKYWAKVHNYHHGHSGMLEVRDIGDIPTLTVNEYRERSAWGKLQYRIFRWPLVTFVVAPAYYLIFSNRYPIFTLNNWKKMTFSQLKNNLIILATYITLGFLLGWVKFLIIQLYIVLVFGVIAFWFFYVQHQHEESYKQWRDNWDYVVSAIKGSTYYKLPKVFQWLTGNIGIHHIHHLSSLIPNYNLEKCMKENIILNKYVTVITFWQSLKIATYKLWDEEKQKMITFAEFKMLEQQRIAA